MRAIHLLVFLSALNRFTNATPIPSPSLSLQIRQTTRQITNVIPGASNPARISDGGGEDYSAPAVLWIVFCAIVGTPLAAAGVRGWKLTSGAGIGLTMSVLVWAAFVNTMSAEGLDASPNTSDLILTSVVFVAFFIGLGLGFLKQATVTTGACLLGGCGGVATSLLLILIRPGLLFPIYFANYAPIGIFALAGVGLPLVRRKIGVIYGSTSCGSFLVVLAIDLVISKQSGMSQGLRFLLDRNDNHLKDLSRAGYKPSITTIVLVIVGLVAIPILGYLQFRFFKEPFDRTPEALEDYKIKTTGKPIVSPLERESKDVDRGYAPFNVRGSVFRGSVAFLTMKPTNNTTTGAGGSKMGAVGSSPLAQPPKSRFSHF